MRSSTIGIALILVGLLSGLTLVWLERGSERGGLLTDDGQETPIEVPRESDPVTPPPNEPAPVSIPQLTPAPIPTPEPEPLGQCYVGGCSGQVCSDNPAVVTTCEWRAEYACYSGATCERQADGQCGWTQTSALSACIAEAKDSRAPY